MKREELEKHCTTMRGWYFADDADKVMDAYEARIKELEEANKRTQKHREEVESSESNIRREMFKMKARIKELEAENERLRMANIDDVAHFDTLKEDYEKLKATISILENNQKEK